MKYDIIVVGGGPAGLTAGIYGARAGKSVLIFERESIGGQISRAALVENYPALPHVSGIDYSAALFEQAEGCGCEIAFEDVLRISGQAGAFTVESDGGSYEASSIVLAVGAASRKLGIEREDELVGRGVSYCAVCDGAFFKGKTVAVVGGGNSALEDALYLASFASKVYLIHRRDAFRAEQAMIDKIMAEGKIETVTPAEIASLNGENRLESVTVKKASGETAELAIDGLFIAIGHAPAAGAFATLVKLDEGGYVVAGEDCKTSCPGIYTAGDCRTKTVRQLTTACGDGAVAALASAEHV
jgi:thioredoxin reductase (NADPH)